jgi:hypothetical protein
MSGKYRTTAMRREAPCRAAQRQECRRQGTCVGDEGPCTEPSGGCTGLGGALWGWRARGPYPGTHDAGLSLASQGRHVGRPVADRSCPRSASWLASARAAALRSGCSAARARASLCGSTTATARQPSNKTPLGVSPRRAAPREIHASAPDVWGGISDRWATTRTHTQSSMRFPRLDGALNNTTLPGQRCSWLPTAPSEGYL